MALPLFPDEYTTLKRLPIALDRVADRVFRDALTKLEINGLCVSDGTTWSLTEKGAALLAGPTAVPDEDEGEDVKPDTSYCPACQKDRPIEAICDQCDSGLCYLCCPCSQRVDDDIDDDEPSFESLTDMSKWTETRAILTRDPETGVITVTSDEPSAEVSAKRYTGVVTAQLAGRSWVDCPELGDQRHKFFTIDADGVVLVGSRVEFETDYQFPGLDGMYWWLKNVRVIEPTPLTDEQEGLLELAESIADGIESGDIVLVGDALLVDMDAAARDHHETMNAAMLLTPEEARFMEKVCRFDGLIVWHSNEAAMRMAEKLEAGGLVTIDRQPDPDEYYDIVSAVRPGEGE